MKTIISVELIQKYIEGKCTSEEAAFVSEWYDSFQHGNDPLITFSEEQQLQLKQKMLERIKINIASIEQQKDEEVAISLPYRRLWYVAASIAAILLLTLGVFLTQQKTITHQVVSYSSELIIKNHSKSLLKQILPDKSIVWLSPGSELKYPKEFAGNTRQVYMKGEAFFEVTKNPERPFIIDSRRIITKVWGTSFRVRAYDNTPEEVSVMTGKVSVATLAINNDEVMLTPHEKVVYLEDKNILQKANETAVSTMRIWEKASLSFDNVPVKVVINVLNKRFAVDIISQDKKLDDYILRADFTEQNLADILEMLRKSLNISSQFDQNKIILKSLTN